jgi:hypothetical protein
VRWFGTDWFGPDRLGLCDGLPADGLPADGLFGDGLFGAGRPGVPVQPAAGRPLGPPPPDEPPPEGEPPPPGAPPAGMPPPAGPWLFGPSLRCGGTKPDGCAWSAVRDGVAVPAVPLVVVPPGVVAWPSGCCGVVEPPVVCGVPDDGDAAGLWLADPPPSGVGVVAWLLGVAADAAGLCEPASGV